MNDLSSILGEMKDLRGAITGAQQESRSYNKTSSYQYKPERARFKLAIYFKDGNKRYFSSYDTATTKDGTRIDEYEGLLKLIKYLNKVEGKYNTAIIYACLDQEKSPEADYFFEVLKYDRFGNKKTNKTVNFKTEGKNSIFDCYRAKYLNKYKI